jgi:aminomethyltransferase
MYLPIGFEGAIEDYNKLLDGVQLWDVACERQIEIIGNDAQKLAQYITPRDVKQCSQGQVMYTTLTDFNGGILNDPVMLKLAEDHYWFSLADGDSLLWVEAIAASYDFDVIVQEPDVSPLQVQGPNATQIMTNVFGDWVQDLAFYKFQKTSFQDIPLVIARMGYSRERCYEIFLCDHSRGNELWEILWAAGQGLNISAGSPNQILRLEAGILSYLSDMDRSNNPYEIGLGWTVDLEQPDNFIGKEALQKIHLSGPIKKLMGGEIHGPQMKFFNEERWPAYNSKDLIGYLTSAAYSPRLGKNIAFILVDIEHAVVGSTIAIESPNENLEAELVELPWFTNRA